MAYCNKLRRNRKRQTEPTATVRRGLRNRRPSLRYTEKDFQLHSPVEFENYLIDKDGEIDYEVSLTFDKTKGNKSCNDQWRGNDRKESSNRGGDMSDGLSVSSVESYDSGVGSKSDDDPVCLLGTPEKGTNSKPITIEVRSPVSNGVIELIDDGGDCFVGFFKPTELTSNSPSKGEDSCIKCSATNIPGRLRRSISTNVSDDSCDSAFHGQSHSSPNSKANVKKLLESKTSVKKSLESKTNVKKSLESKTNVKKSLESKTNVKKSLESKTNVKKSLESKPSVKKSMESKTNVKMSMGSKTNVKKLIESKPRVKKPKESKANVKRLNKHAKSTLYVENCKSKKPSPAVKLKRKPKKPETKTTVSKRSRSPLKQAKDNVSKRRRVSSAPHRTPHKQTNISNPPSPKVSKPSPSKSALRRIQHHNRSPERSSDVMATNAAGWHCRTRSHVKSILKDRLSNSPTSTKMSNSRLKLNSPKLSPRSLYKNSSGLKPRFPKPTNVKENEKYVDGERGENQNTAEPTSDTKQHSSACHWRFCKTEVAAADLADHIERLHVASQRRNSKSYRCFWEGCKVYGQVAKSIIWLEGHVKKHLGPRPYHCIFPNCSIRFSSQELLQKHVDSHIVDSKEPIKPTKTKKVDTVAAKKTEKKCMKRLRGTEKCIPKRADFMSGHIIEAMKWECKMLNEKWLHILTEEKDSVRLQGQIVAMDTEMVGDKEGPLHSIQLHWFPEELGVADSWHDITDEIAVTRTKLVKISTLPRDRLFGFCHDATSA